MIAPSWDLILMFRKRTSSVLIWVAGCDWVGGAAAGASEDLGQLSVAALRLLVTMRALPHPGP